MSNLGSMRRPDHRSIELHHANERSAERRRPRRLLWRCGARWALIPRPAARESVWLAARLPESVPTGDPCARRETTRSSYARAYRARRSRSTSPAVSPMIVAPTRRVRSATVGSAARVGRFWSLTSCKLRGPHLRRRIRRLLGVETAHGTERDGSREAVVTPACIGARPVQDSLCRVLALGASKNGTENPRVGGSTPSLGILKMAKIAESSTEFVIAAQVLQGTAPFSTRGHTPSWSQKSHSAVSTPSALDVGVEPEIRVQGGVVVRPHDVAGGTGIAGGRKLRPVCAHRRAELLLRHGRGVGSIEPGS